MKKPLLLLGLVAIGILVGFPTGMLVERFAAPAGIEIPLPAVVVSTITADINKDGKDDYAFYDGKDVMIAFSGEDGKFAIATVIGTAFDEMGGNLEMIITAGAEVFSVPVNEENRAVSDLACNTARPFQP